MYLLHSSLRCIQITQLWKENFVDCFKLTIRADKSDWGENGDKDVYLWLLLTTNKGERQAWGKCKGEGGVTGMGGGTVKFVWFLLNYLKLTYVFFVCL